jgi:hypothetical protein
MMTAAREYPGKTENLLSAASELKKLPSLDFTGSLVF